MGVGRIEGLTPCRAAYDIMPIDDSSDDDIRKIAPIGVAGESRYDSTVCSLKEAVEAGKPASIDTISSAAQESRPTLERLGLTTALTPQQRREQELFRKSIASELALPSLETQTEDLERILDFLPRIWIVGKIEDLFNQFVDFIFRRDKVDGGKVSSTEDSWLDAIKKGNDMHNEELSDEFGNLDRLLHEALVAMRKIVGEAAQNSLEDVEELREKLKKIHAQRAENAEKMAEAIEKAKFSQKVEKVVSALALGTTIAALLTIATVGNVGAVAVGGCVAITIILAVVAMDRLTDDHLKKLITDAFCWGIEKLGISKYTGGENTSDNLARILGFVSGAVEVLAMAVAGFLTGAIQAIALGAQSLSQGYSAFKDYDLRKFEGKGYAIDMEKQKLDLKVQDAMGKQTGMLKIWLDLFKKEKNITTDMLTDLIKHLFREIR